MHDSKEFSEKSARLVKNEFASKKRKFAGNLIEKSHADKMLNHLANEE